MMKRSMGFFGVFAGAIICGTALAGAADITELTLTDLTGAARSDEPVRMGIPLARGQVKESAELALTDAAGKPVPCQFKDVMRWDDNSVRWVHAVFKASVPAKGKTTVKLVTGKAAESKSKVEVTEANGAITVANGVLKLVVKGPEFNLFDSASFDPSGKFGAGTEIVKPHKDGFIVTLADKTYRAGADSKVIVEEKGAECAVLRASGRLVGEDGKGPFDYVCYIHVFAGSPVVRANFSYTDSDGVKAGDCVPMQDFSLELPTTLGGGVCKVGGESKVFQGKAGKIFAKNSDLSEISIDGAQAGTAKGKSTKPNNIGWVDLSNGGKGVAVGVRWFWQMFPKAMEVTADGKLRAALYAKESEKPLNVYMGQGRTHYLTFYFHAAADDAALQNFFTGTQMPLRALATPKYYCRDTEAFGKIADADPAIYPADAGEAEKRYNGLLKSSLDKISKKIDGFDQNGVTLDSYGYLAWGDLFHYANAAGVTDPWNILWESNYYDFPWACGLQFVRTGDPVFLDFMDRNGLNLADVFMCKWAPDPKYCGACRYSPPANFVGNDTDYKKPVPYFSTEFNHHKAQSILARYYFLGDLRARDDFMLALNNAMKNPEASWKQSRGPGAKLATLYSGYILTHDPKILEKMKECVAGALKNKGNPKNFTNQGETGWFMMGIAAEGLTYYWMLTGDKDVLQVVQEIDDYLLPEVGKKGKYPPKDRITSNLSFSLGVNYRETGDEKYKAAALELFKLNAEEKRPKGFGQQWRNSAYTWYYLSNLPAKK